MEPNPLHPVTELNRTEDVANFGVYLPSEFLKVIHLHSASGGLKYIAKGQIAEIKDIRSFDKQLGVTDRRLIAMFPDEIEALKLAFEKVPLPAA